MEIGPIILAIVLVTGVASAAFAIYSRWQQSRTPTRQVPPEQAKQAWLDRERQSQKPGGI